MSEEKKQKLKEYQKSYRVAKKENITSFFHGFNNMCYIF